jgi:hypothetical protein
MRYMALIYGDEAARESLGERDAAGVLAEYGAFAERLSAVGKLVGGAELASTATATTVRVRGGETLVTDGPYAEVKEALGGYFLLECDSIDEACRLAEEIPGAVRGSVEVRPAHVEEG